jgi:uncharacterized protein YegL
MKTATIAPNASSVGLTDIEFTTNPEARCGCCIAADISDSMKGRPIAELNAGLIELKHCLVADPLACLRVELALISFNSVVKTEVDFTGPTTFQPPTLIPSGGTSLGAAVIQGLDLIKARTAGYRAAGLPCFRPWLVVITDGEATDDVTEAARLVKEMETQKRVAFFGVGVQSANMHKLAELSHRAPLRLDGLRFSDWFQWLSASLSAVALSRPGDQVPLPPPDWAAV